jgi:3-(3-hydroxy-phenyl)propionate hydroxylase
MPDVAIVGFGPVGAALAALLARAGRDVVVFDRDTDVYPLPRAAHLDHEIMRILQAVGCADECAPGMRTNQGMDFLDADRELLLRFQTPGMGPSGWPSSLLFHQPSFDRALRVAAVDAGARVQLGHSVEHLDALDARFVIGCDGARSTVRREIGVELDDLAFEEPWLVVDTLVDDPTLAPELPDRALQICDPARPHTLVPMPSPRFRFEFMLLPGEAATEMQRPERVKELIASWVDPGRLAVERAAVYTFHGLIARQWRRGSVLLAGDAAHQMPPFLGQGMCSGLRDAINLAWKLDLVLAGRAPDGLLSTYQTEREPHVRQIVEAAVSFGRMICTLDAEEAAARNAMLRANGPQTRTEAPAMPGTLAIQGRVEVDGRVARFDDVFGAGWRLVTREPVEPNPWFTAIGGRALAIGTDFVDVDGTYEQALRAHDAVAFLQRPDFGLFAAGEPDALLARALEYVECSS